MANPRAVKRALATLADGEPLPDWHRTHVIEAAADAIDDLDAGVDFYEEYGLAELEHAILTAERTGETGLARRGQRAHAAFAWLARASTNENRSSESESASQAPESSETESDSREPGHFHCGHGTPLGGHGERDDT